MNQTITPFKKSSPFASFLSFFSLLTALFLFHFSAITYAEDTPETASSASAEASPTPTEIPAIAPRCGIGISEGLTAINSGWATATIQDDGSIKLTGNPQAGGGYYSYWCSSWRPQTWASHRVITPEQLGAKPVALLPFSSSGFAARLENGEVVYWEGSESYSENRSKDIELHRLEGVKATKMVCLDIYSNDLMLCINEIEGMNDYGLMILADHNLHLFAHTYSNFSKKVSRTNFSNHTTTYDSNLGSANPDYIEQTDQLQKLSHFPITNVDDITFNNNKFFITQAGDKKVIGYQLPSAIIPTFSRANKSTQIDLELNTQWSQLELKPGELVNRTIPSLTLTVKDGKVTDQEVTDPDVTGGAVTMTSGTLPSTGGNIDLGEQHSTSINDYENPQDKQNCEDLSGK